MKYFNPDRYAEHTREELIGLVCVSAFDLQVLKCLLMDAGVDMCKPIDYSYYRKLLDPSNELKGLI